MALKTLLMSATAAALLAGSAVAQEATTGTGTDMQTGTETPAVPTFTDIRDMTVGDAIGWNVYGPDGGTVGDVDYIVDQPDGAAAVIGVGGFLGLGEYTVAVPLADLELGPEGMSFTLDTDKEALKAQPEFDESNAESLPDETRLADIMEPEEEDAPAAGDAPEDAPADGDATDDGSTEGDAPADGSAGDDTMEDES